MHYRIVIAFSLFLFMFTAVGVCAENAAPAPAAATIFIVHDSGTEELLFDGFHAACAGYGPNGVKYDTPAGAVTVAWPDVAYVLPQWEEGFSLAGASFKTAVLRPASCPEGYVRKVKKKTVKVKNKSKVVEEETRYPLHTIHLIAFSKEGVESGQRALEQKGTRFDPGTGMEFVQVRGGCFERGDSTGEGEENEKHVQRLCLDEFSMAKYEVTQAQWRSVMNTSPSGNKACGDNCPVENMTWYDVQDFLRLLKQKTGWNYRLPTEAEWEFAARSGGRKDVWSGTSSEDAVGEVAWFNGNADGRTHAVGAKNPNTLGLYDMSGNVAEWTGDRYDKDYYRSSPQKNPPGPSNGDHRVSRGGSFRYGPKKVRTGFRDHDNPNTKNGALGFRLVLEGK
ncbi:MAG: formylglycine-generating enzyme family protein [Nitrospirota bacterium]|nr:formylglycine-generating enzyme family protein [Nitrospirota bacterium]